MQSLKKLALGKTLGGGKILPFYQKTDLNILVLLYARCLTKLYMYDTFIVVGSISIKRREMMNQKKSCLTKKIRNDIISRLSRIEGQIKGLKGMAEEGRYCLDILQQVSSVYEALRGVGKVLMRNYLEVCATDAIQSRRREKQEEIYNELMDAIYKFIK